LRTGNAKEFTSQEMVDFCKQNDIILLPVVAACGRKVKIAFIIARKEVI